MSRIFAIMDPKTGEFTGAVTWCDLKSGKWAIQNGEDEPVEVDFDPSDVFELVRTTPRLSLHLIRKKLRFTREEIAKVLGITVCAWDSCCKDNQLPVEKLDLLTELLRRRMAMDRKKT